MAQCYILLCPKHYTKNNRGKKKLDFLGRNFLPSKWKTEARKKESKAGKVVGLLAIRNSLKNISYYSEMGGKGQRRREKNYAAAHGGHSRLPPPPVLSQIDAVPSKLRKLMSLTSSLSSKPQGSPSLSLALPVYMPIYRFLYLSQMALCLFQSLLQRMLKLIK